VTPREEDFSAPGLSYAAFLLMSQPGAFPSAKGDGGGGRAIDAPIDELPNVAHGVSVVELGHQPRAVVQPQLQRRHLTRA
jgi:hypothetical protein